MNLRIPYHLRSMVILAGIYIVKPSIQPFHFTPNCTEVIIIPVKNSAPSMVKCWALIDQYAVNKYL